MIKQLTSICASPEQARYEVSLLLEHACHLMPTAQIQQANSLFTEIQLQPALALLEKRLQDRVPIQYLLGQCGFYGLTLKVTPDVLIPRPETEHLVEKALACIQTLKRTLPETDIRVLDMCTGSGAIALAIASHSKAQVLGVDLSPQALRVARENQERLGIPRKQLTFIESDLFTALSSQAPFHLILCNPPYIDLALAETLAPEVRNHEPHLALFSPSSADYFYLELAKQAPEYLHTPGWLIVEIGAGQAVPVMQHFETICTPPFSTVESVSDYAGITRMICAYRQN